MIEINISNRQRKYKVDMVELRRLAMVFAEAAQRREAGEEWLELEITLLSDRGIAPINLTYLGHEGSTDVITQRYDSMPGEPCGVRGELFINVEQAWGVAASEGRSGWSAGHELALYLAHGCDHLSGAEDLTARGRRVMRQRELRWVAAARVQPSLVRTVGR